MASYLTEPYSTFKGGLHWRSGGAGNGGVRDGGNGGGGGASGWSKEGNGDDGDGEGSVTLPQDVSELLAKAGRKFTELPTSTQKALMAGSMTSALLKRYLEVERRGGMVAQLLSISIFRDRLLMDVYLMDKIGIEMAVGGRWASPNECKSVFGIPPARCFVHPVRFL